MTNSAADAFEWMRERQKGTEQILFRGQNQVWDTIYPSLFRPHITAPQRRCWLKVAHTFIRARNGITGYTVSHVHEAVAIMQHYLMYSWVIDLTSNPLIALYFATQPRNQNAQGSRVIYAIDTSKIDRSKYELSEPDFLIKQLDDGGSQHRWIKQSGYTLGKKDWQASQVPGDFDLLKLNPERYDFTTQPTDSDVINKIDRLGNLESIENDPLAAAVRGTFEACAKHVGCETIVSNMLEGTATISQMQQLRAEIDGLIELAINVGASDDEMAELEKIREASTKSHWDTSWEAALDYWSQKIFEKL